MRIAGLAQQRLRPRNRAIDMVAIRRHHVGRQRIQIQRHIGRVRGQWCDRVGIVGKCDQRDLPATAQAQQVSEFRPRLCKPIRRQVGCQCRLRQIERHDQRLAGLQQGLLQLAQARPGQCQHRQHACQQGHPPRPVRRVLATLAGIEQMRQQMRIDCVLPDRAAA